MRIVQYLVVAFVEVVQLGIYVHNGVLGDDKLAGLGAGRRYGGALWVQSTPLMREPTGWIFGGDLAGARLQ